MEKYNQTPLPNGKEIKKHQKYNEKDFLALRAKGYTHFEIEAIWNGEIEV